MESKHLNKDEDYLYSLPDYVNGKLPDGPLKSGIEDRIKSDMKFRTEYESMLGTLKFVKDTSLEEPPEHYFNSLVPRINERLESAKRPAVHPVFHLWRYIVPALTVILVMVIILRPEKEKFENVVSDTQQNTIAKIVVPDTLTGIQETLSDSEEQESAETVSQTFRQKALKQNNTRPKETESIIENIGDLFGESEETSAEESEYYNYESDFRTLSPAEQNELLTNLEKTKF